jgi:HAD superfamily hydrolase (TIGR01484 family)
MSTPTPPAPIKLIVLDIDGTIAGRDNEVSPEVKAAVRAAINQGVRVGIATGRMYQSALRFHQEIGANVPVMAYQGAWIQDPATQQQYRHLQVDATIAEELIDYFEQPHLPADLSVHVYVDDKLYVKAVKDDTEEYTQRSAVKAHPVADLRSILGGIAPTKVLAMHSDVDLISKLLQDLKSRYSRDRLHAPPQSPFF